MTEKILKAEYGSDKTPLTIGTIQIPCYVLEGGMAVLSGNGMQKAIGFNPKSSGMALKNLLSTNKISPFVSPELAEKINNPIKFLRKDSGGSQPITYGYEANVLIDICYVLIDAKNSGTVLTEKQIRLANIANSIERAFSKTGIESVIYKLTGYLDKQVETFLNDILNKYLLDEAKKYYITYPLELYKEWFRLNNWEWKPENKQKRPSCIGSWTNEYIYARIHPKLLPKLKKINPKNEKGYREHKHFQFLTNDVGEPRLREFFGGLIALAKANQTWRRYVAMVNIAYPKYGDTITMNLDFQDDKE